MLPTSFKVIPVLVLNDVDNGLKMCEVLCENGLPVAEITFRTAAAADIIAAASKRFPEMLIGAGTILNRCQICRCSGFQPHRSQSGYGNEI